MTPSTTGLRAAATALLITSLGGLANPARAEDAPAQERAIGAAVDFSVGYGVWLWEKTCRVMSAADQSAFDTVITSDLKALSGAVDMKLFSAATGAGQKTSEDPSNPACGDPKANDFAQFGLQMAKSASEKLGSLPPGYHLSVTD